MAQAVDDNDDVQRMGPVDDQQQFLRAIRLEVDFLDDLSRIEQQLEFCERAVDGPELVEGVLADDLRELPGLGLGTRSTSAVWPTPPTGSRIVP